MNRFMNWLLVAVILACIAPAIAAEPPAFRIERMTTFVGPEDYYYMQTRGTAIPTEPGRVLVLTQEIEKTGSHGFRDVFQIDTRDGGKTWQPPVRIESLRRAKQPDRYDIAIGDLCPLWHAATKTVLATGKTFNFRDGKDEVRARERVSYGVYSPETNAWSGLKLVELPEKDHEGLAFLQPNSGCCQRVDLPDGEILLPIRYCKQPGVLNYTTIVARCRFDGSQLTYVRHGSELTLATGRGLYEPSLVEFHGRYYLTLRANDSAYVTASDDGLKFEPIAEWKYDDGQPLGSYNTQQHWVKHRVGLFLVYTRRGANNDHVFRHRAPLFIAQVDPKRRCIMRATEQILIPENQADLGNFGVIDVSPGETWVIASEQLTNTKRQAERNQTWIAKLIWSAPIRD